MYVLEHPVLITYCFVGRRDRGDPIGQELQGFVQRFRLRAVQGRGKRCSQTYVHWSPLTASSLIQKYVLVVLLFGIFF